MFYKTLENTVFVKVYIQNVYIRKSCYICYIVTSQRKERSTTMIEEIRGKEIKRSVMLMESMCVHCRDSTRCPESTEKKENAGLLPTMKCPGFVRG